jgi:hypothetical protein
MQFNRYLVLQKQEAELFSVQTHTILHFWENQKKLNNE